MNDIKVKNRRVNKKKALIMILLGITILGVINRTWAYVDEQIKIKAEQERLAEEKRKAEKGHIEIWEFFILLNIG